MELSKQDKFILLRLFLDAEGIGTNRLLHIISKLRGVNNLVDMKFNDLLTIDGINRELANRLVKQRHKFQEYKILLEPEIEQLRKLNAKIITYFDDNYPKLLKKIYSPPLILYTLGNIESYNNCVSIVGTRKPTVYGKRVAERIAGDLAKQKLTIVSGLARGIDSEAHWGALKNNGKTIAVTGSGLDVIYPPENKKLYNKIVEKGMVVTEYPLGTKPDAQNFPKRNRIIAGFSLGTVIIETRITGGAIQTAHHALDQNREVFAVPGNIEVPQSEGTNILIQKGEAKLIRNAEDILIELKLKLKPEIGKNIPKPTVDLNLFEEKIFNALGSDPIQIDNLSEKTKLSSSDCLVHLLSLEFKGLVRQYPGKMFSLT